MVSSLIITGIEEMQFKINDAVKRFEDRPSIYISLNRTQKSTESIMKKSGIKTSKIFFIDCVTSEKESKEVLHISPSHIDTLTEAAKSFIIDIKDKKFVVIDALSSLLIYNREENVIDFLREIINCASDNNAEVFAFTPKTRGEYMLNSISELFDNVEE